MNDPFSNLIVVKVWSYFFLVIIFAEFPERKKIFVIFGKMNVHLAKTSQNRQKFLLTVGKCMGPILGQHLVNEWISFISPAAHPYQN